MGNQPFCCQRIAQYIKCLIFLSNEKSVIILFADFNLSTRILRTGCVAWQNRSQICRIYILPLTDKKYDLSTQSRELRLCVKTKYALAWCFMFHSFKFDLQHAYFQLQKRFDPTPGVNDVCKDRAALCSITFNLI